MARSRTPFVNAIRASGPRMMTTRQQQQRRDPPTSLHALVVIDATGLKVYGAGEWLVEKHGTKRRRSWRKMHLGVDADTGRIVAATLTDRDEDDAAQVGPLLDQVA